MTPIRDSEHRNPPRAVEDYTAAFLVSLVPLVLMALVAIWAALGYLAACAAAALADLAIRRLGRGA